MAFPTLFSLVVNKEGLWSRRFGTILGKEEVGSLVLVDLLMIGK